MSMQAISDSRCNVTRSARERQHGSCRVFKVWHKRLYGLVYMAHSHIVFGTLLYVTVLQLTLCSRAQM